MGQPIFTCSTSAAVCPAIHKTLNHSDMVKNLLTCLSYNIALISGVTYVLEQFTFKSKNKYEYFCLHPQLFFVLDYFLKLVESATYSPHTIVMRRPATMTSAPVTTLLRFMSLSPYIVNNSNTNPTLPLRLRTPRLKHLKKFH